MKVKGRLVHRIEVRKTKRGPQVILWGKAGRGSQFALGALSAVEGTASNLLRNAVESGKISEVPKTP